MSKFSICEIEKDREYVNHYECATHGVWYRDDDENPSEFCPVGEVESELAEHVQQENEMLKDLFIWADNWLPDEAKDQGARAVLQKVRTYLAGTTDEH